MIAAARQHKILGAGRRSHFAAPGGIRGSGRERAPLRVNWAELIGRIATSSDRQAFGLIFAHFAPRIKGLMLRTGLDAERSEEIAQEALIAVWRKASQFDASSKGASAWIYAIARNLRIDLARRSARAERFTVLAEAEYAFLQNDPTDNLAGATEDARRVSEALKSLPPDQSKVIRLAFLEERPHSEIAEVIGLPLGTVKSRIRLAMKRLRYLLEEPL